MRGFLAAILIVMFSASMAFGASGSFFIDVQASQLVPDNVKFIPGSDGLMGRAGRYDVAVVIGNKDYQAEGNGVPDVDFALNDARMMKKYLEKALGYDPRNIIYKENATNSDFLMIFGSSDSDRSQLGDYVRPGKSRVLIYYVGHGAPDLDSHEAYFVPVNAAPRYIKNTGYSLQTFYSKVDELPAKSITVVLDSCFSGQSNGKMLYKDISPMMLKVDKSIVKPSKALIITSADMDQVSSWYTEKKHSLFTYFFLKAVQGEADLDRDDKINVSELEEYLRDEVSFTARRNGIQQDPVVTGHKNRLLMSK